VSEDGDIVKYALLATGSMYGLAREAQLKIKEMVLLPSDSYVSLGLQHGPMSNVDGGMLLTMLASAPGLSYEREVARNMKALGGKVFVPCGERHPLHARPPVHGLLQIARGRVRPGQTEEPLLLREGKRPFTRMRVDPQVVSQRRKKPADFLYPGFIIEFFQILDGLSEGLTCSIEFTLRPE